MPRLIVEADGGSRGNPGPAGYGALVRDADGGAVLARRNGFLGIATNNVAEYSGLIAGLEAAAELAPGGQVEVRLDSKLIVEQMNGTWKVKSEDLRPYAIRANGLKGRFAEIRFVWVPRRDNGRADALANEAMDARRSTYETGGGDSAPDVPTAAASEDGTLFEVPEASSATVARENVVPAWRHKPEVALAEVVLLRHGQTIHSIDRRFSGSSDPELTELGRQQVWLAAERLGRSGGFDAIVTSPRVRARSTAEAVGAALGLEPFVDEAWRECDFGEFEGLTWDEINERSPGALDAWLAGPDVPAPGGESFADVVARVRPALAALGEKFGGRRVLVVSHVTPIKVAAIRAIDAPSSALFALHLDLASLTRIAICSDGPWVFRTWNDTAHLDALDG